ncbi:MAG: hypothetical protein ACM3XR_00465 [Bacillota bacterium]
MLKKELSQQRPIIIRIDYYWCPWNKDVDNQFHNPKHTTLVIGYDETGLICLDYSPRCDRCILPYEYIEKISGYFLINTYEPISCYNYRDILNRSIQTIETHDIFNTMRKFGRFIQESFNPIKELENVENNAYIPKVWQLSLIAESRCLYANTLKAIYKKHNLELLLTIAEKLESTKPMWLVIKSLFAKIYIEKNLGLKKRIAEKVFKIADYEESIYKCLLEIRV